MDLLDFDIYIIVFEFLDASDELERHEEYFVNLAISILDAVKVVNNTETCYFEDQMVDMFLHFVTSWPTRRSWGLLFLHFGSL